MATVSALGVVMLTGESAAQAIARFLASRHLLLVVDNCEHVLGAAPFIAELLEACPGLTVLATSREALAIRAEERYPVPTLAVDTPRSAEAGDDAVALFVERARAHYPGFELADRNAAAVVEICRRLDGLPLAIELAAARCGLLSPSEIAERLDAALGALGGGTRDAPARQQTLRATIDWSYDLLDDDERACFARFAVFAGGATVDAAQAITSAELVTLERLVGKSLLVSTAAKRRRRRGWTCSKPFVRTLPTASPSPPTPRTSANATTATSSHLLNATAPNGRCGARAATITSPGWTSTSRTCTPRSNGRSAKRIPGHPRSPSATRSAPTG